ncbi:MAG: hypothetical protein AB7I19_06600 [Planctomycetota bacterium]
MFDRFVRLAQARRAVRESRLEEALALASDPMIAGHRRAEDLRREICNRLLRRAGERVRSAAVELARADLERVLKTFPNHPEAESALAALGPRDAAAEPAATAEIEGVRAALGRGELAAARASLERAKRVRETAETRRLDTALVAAKSHVDQALGSASVAIQAGRWRDAAAELCTAHKLAVDDPAVLGAIGAFVRSHSGHLVRELSAARGATDAVSFLREWERLAAALPGLATTSEFQSLRTAAIAPLRQAIVVALSAGDLAVAKRALGDIGSLTGMDRETELVGRLERGLRAEEEGADLLAAEDFERLARDLSAADFALRAARLRSRAAAIESGLRTVRELAAAGSIHEARLALLELTVQHPGHRGLLDEGRLLDEGALDRARQLESARKAAATGDLREANRLALALAVPGNNGEEPRALLAEIRQRMDAVQAGLNQVLSRLHDRACSSPDGIRQCLARLDQLALLQRDHEDLTRVRTSLTAELSALESLETAEACAASPQVEELRNAVAAYLSQRPALLSAERLDARALRTGEKILEDAGRRLTRGETARARLLAEICAPLAAVLSGLQREHAMLLTRVDEACANARHHAAIGRRALAEKDLDLALESLQSARAGSLDEPEVLRLADEIAARSRADEAVTLARAHAHRRDFGAAHREIDQLGPTAPLMRTKIFDLKRELAKAQGLGTAFLLRVDEGGEFLVVRGESLTIGNLRDKCADLPMLANVAGRHARLVRTMSFHGGQVDKLVAEGGEVFANGERVRELKLAGRVRFRLGPTVEMEYRLPGSRSLTAALTILGGFVVAGTDRVLWMKDRGRDGRILIGANPDAHVVVAGADVELELFADRDGRVMVRAPQGATMDGKPIAGEYPLSAGVEVRAGNLSFVALPWQRP